MKQLGHAAEWAGQSNVHPLGALILAICLISIFMVKRERAIYPLVFLLIAIPSAQRFIVFDLDFSFMKPLRQDSNRKSIGRVMWLGKHI